jgi:hypothetical protein
MLFDTETGSLRRICLGAQEAVRAVLAAVRDQNWDTVECAVRDVRVATDRESFVVTFDAESERSPIGFRWDGRITGDSCGTIEYAFRGRATSDFLRNRIGLCVLHPIRECSGCECVIEQTDGASVRGTFPRWIAPHQPFGCLRAITHVLPCGTGVRVSMSGETFEMEDQRNWGDASFKTYCTPLARPFPVRIEAGTVLEQTVRIELAGDVRTPESVIDGPPVIRVNWDRPVVRPPVGFLLADPAIHLPPAVTEALRHLKPDHLRLDVRLSEEGWQAPWQGAVDLCRTTGAALEVALFVDERAGTAWKELQSLIEHGDVPIARCLLFHVAEKTTPASLTAAAIDRVRKLGSTIPLVVGTDAYFAELNRGRPEAATSRLVCFSFNPQVHASDDLSLSETLEALPEMIDSAHHLSGAEVVVSPVSFRPRFNPNATAKPLPEAERRRLAIDPRQASGFGAAWTVGVLSRLLPHPHLNSLTIYEASGPRGVVGDLGEWYPLTAVFREVLQCGRLFEAHSSRPLEVVAVAAERPDGRRIVLLANLSVERHAACIADSRGMPPKHDVVIDREMVQLVTVGEDGR